MRYLFLAVALTLLPSSAAGQVTGHRILEVCQGVVTPSADPEAMVEALYCMGIVHGVAKVLDLLRQKGFGVAIALVAVLVEATSAQEIQFDTLRHGVVRVGQAQSEEQTEFSWTGTGFVVDEQCTVVTAKHVVEPLDRSRMFVQVEYPEDLTRLARSPVQLLLEREDVDLAFLRMTACADWVTALRLTRTETTSETVGSSVTIVGYPTLLDGWSSDTPILRRGHVAAAGLKTDLGQTLLLDLISVRGFSGSPVILDSTGHVIGVVWGTGNIERSLGFQLVTPISLADYDEAIATAP